MKKSHSLSVNRAGVQEEDLGAAARNSKPLYACRSQGVRPSQLCLPQLNCICTIKYARFKLIASYPGTFEKEISRIPAILVLIVTAIKPLFENRRRYWLSRLFSSFSKSSYPSPYMSAALSTHPVVHLLPHQVNALMAGPSDRPIYGAESPYELALNSANLNNRICTIKYVGVPPL